MLSFTIISALLIGFIYGSISVKGQFCMNSGFSNVVRKKDYTKLKSFIAAILVQMLILPLLFTVLYTSESMHHLVANIGLPPLFLVASALGGFIFGLMMYYSGGCGAGIFFKIGEKKADAIFAAIGFIIGVYITEKGILNFIKSSTQSWAVFNQPPIWQGDSPLIAAFSVVVLSAIALFFLFRTANNTPSGAEWGWKKTGVTVGIIGIIGWISALGAQMTYGMNIMAGTIDMVDLNYTWPLMFVLGIPIGAFWVARNNERKFAFPKGNIISKRLVGGFGLGVSGSIAAGCTVGHGLTFAPLLAIGSFVAVIFIFIGSGLVGYLTRT
jgi:uncharacterized protein